MSDPLGALQAAAYAALAADPAVKAALGDPARIYDVKADKGAEYPYATLGRSDESNGVAPDACGTEAMLAVDIWYRDGGALPAKAAANAVRSVLDTPLAAAGFTVHAGDFVSVRTRDERDGETFRLIVTFRYLTTPSA